MVLYISLVNSGGISSSDSFSFGWDMWRVVAIGTSRYALVRFVMMTICDIVSKAPYLVFPLLFWQ